MSSAGAVGGWDDSAVPREIELVQEIPTNPAGKVLKRELRGRGS